MLNPTHTRHPVSETVSNRYRASDGANFTLRKVDLGQYGYRWIVVRTYEHGACGRNWHFDTAGAARAFFDSLD